MKGALSLSWILRMFNFNYLHLSCGCYLSLKPDLIHLTLAAFPTLFPGNRKYEKPMEEVMPFGSFGHLLIWAFTLFDDLTLTLGFSSSTKF